MDIIGKLFGNPELVKLIRFLLLNDRKSYSILELGKRTGISPRVLKRELEHLTRARFVRGKSEYELQKKGRRKKKIVLFSLRPDFPYRKALKELFLSAQPISAALITRALGKAGRVKLIIASGVFVGEPDGRLDLLVVGDRMDKKALDRAVRSLEKTIGRDLRYTILETPDFTYRVSVLDRLVRDVLDYPHQKILNRIGF